ncbi:hypothetical protein PC9H_011769 [Pleurotus ostreatus]|uniref:Uncharacterized protein n=1 Tax=Pleurotus ostreatus TaxID=5322 RepID=A0A8H6ZLN9_PLEOS|nr:uncharacterized protein PC9H_011769 [Pleurotus ostreatus]KAF7421248.1 hypothetical protein PC9H_011769 [Pleurotus ostreatus]
MLANRWMSAQARRVVDTALSPTATPIDINEEEEAGELVVKGRDDKAAVTLPLRATSPNSTRSRMNMVFSPSNASSDGGTAITPNMFAQGQRGTLTLSMSTTTRDNTSLACDEPQLHAIKDEHGVLPVERQLRQRHDDHAEHVCAGPARDDDAG